MPAEAAVEMSEAVEVVDESARRRRLLSSTMAAPAIAGHRWHPRQIRASYQSDLIAAGIVCLHLHRYSFHFS